MSRHRTIRNLDEDDYYDDYDEDDDDYYLEQQRLEKEKKQKEAAAKKIKANQLKQQQLQKEQQQLQKKKKATVAAVDQTNSTKKGSSSKSVAISSSAVAGGLSVVGNKKSVPGLNVESNGHANHDINSTNPNSNNNNSTAAEIPKIPPNILQTLTTTTAKIRPHLSLVILGHVDTGKSTLTGRLLLQLNHVSSRLLAKYQKASTQIGKSSFALAWFTDEDDSERERGVTIDVGTKFARLERYDLTLLDAPGHRDFIPNMISGAAGADCGLLVVAATTGEFEAGFASLEDGDDENNHGGGNNRHHSYGGSSSGGRLGGQTREHIVLSRGLGVNQLVVAINKLDASDPPWSEGRFEHIKSRVLPFLLANNYKPKQIRFVPVSGLTGVNVSSNNNNGSSSNSSSKEEDVEGWKALKTWYKGPTLIEALDSFNPPKREFEKPMRLIVTDVSPEGKNVSVRGRVVQGFIRASDTVAVLPVGDEATVVRVERGKAAREDASPYSFVAAPTATATSTSSSSNATTTAAAALDVEDFPDLQNCALAGDTAEITLSGIDAVRLSPGCVICHPHPSLRPLVKRKFLAKLAVMERLAVPIIRGSQVLFHMHSIDVPAVLTKLVESTNRTSGHTRQNPRVLSGGANAVVEITVNERLVLEAYNDCRSLGRFVLRRGGDTVAVGLIDKVFDS